MGTCASSSTGDDQVTAVCAERDDPSAVRALIDDGASADSAIMEAARHRRVETVKALLPLADLSKRTADGKSVLHVAIEAKADVGVQAIVDDPKGRALLNEPDRSGVLPLHLACRRGDMNKVAILVRAGADLKQLDEAGKTARENLATEEAIAAFEKLQ